METATRRRHDGDMSNAPTATTASGIATDGAHPDVDEPRLRLVLTANATTSGLGGLAALLLGEPTAALLGTDEVLWVRLLGAGLVAFAAFVARTARAPRPRLIRDVPSISAGDAAWVFGTIVTVTLGWYSTSGVVVMGLVGTMVATFGTMQAILVRRLRSDD